MSNKRDLRAFMRESAKTEEIITVPGPDTILGDDGKPIMLEIKALHGETVRKIHENYRTKTVAMDGKGNPYINNGKVVFREEFDVDAASQHVIVEALVYPDLKDKELMAFFNCHDITEMPRKVFPSNREFRHIDNAVAVALGLKDPTPEEKEKTLEEVKN